MNPSLLHVVTCVSNPLRWKSRIELYRNFERHMFESGVHLTVVECALGERPFELGGNPLIDFVGVRHSTFTFNKECLLNIGIQDVVRRYPDVQYIALLDADVRFRNLHWANETVHALQRFEVVQTWTDCYDLGPHGQHLELHRSFGKMWQDQQPIMQGPNATGGGYRFGHPGYAWAWRRSALAAVGLLPESAILGAADHHMAMALVGRVADSIPGNLEPAYTAPLVKWQTRALRLGMNLGAVPGTIEHSFHGSKQKRRYVERWEILHKWKFDPQVDLIKNEFGVVELAGNKPGLRMDIERYFSERAEDANSV